MAWVSSKAQLPYILNKETWHHKLTLISHIQGFPLAQTQKKTTTVIYVAYSFWYSDNIIRLWLPVKIIFQEDNFKVD